MSSEVLQVSIQTPSSAPEEAGYSYELPNGTVVTAATRAEVFAVCPAMAELVKENPEQANFLLDLSQSLFQKQQEIVLEKPEALPEKIEVIKPDRNKQKEKKVVTGEKLVVDTPETELSEPNSDPNLGPQFELHNDDSQKLAETNRARKQIVDVQVVPTTEEFVDDTEVFDTQPETLEIEETKISIPVPVFSSDALISVLIEPVKLTQEVVVQPQVEMPLSELEIKVADASKEASLVDLDAVLSIPVVVSQPEVLVPALDIPGDAISPQHPEEEKRVELRAEIPQVYFSPNILDTIPKGAANATTPFLEEKIVQALPPTEAGAVRANIEESRANQTEVSSENVFEQSGFNEPPGKVSETIKFEFESTVRYAMEMAEAQDDLLHNENELITLQEIREKADTNLVELSMVQFGVFLLDTKEHPDLLVQEIISHIREALLVQSDGFEGETTLQNLSPELLEKTFELLTFLGYENPEEAYQQYTLNHDNEELIQSLEYICEIDEPHEPIDELIYNLPDLNIPADIFASTFVNAEKPIFMADQVFSEHEPITEFEVFVSETLPTVQVQTLEHVRSMAEVKPVVEVFVETASVFLTDKVTKDEKDYLVSIAEDIAEILSMSKEDAHELTPELEEKTIKLLSYLGYENPEKALEECIKSRGIDFLFEALHYISELPETAKKKKFELLLYSSGSPNSRRPSLEVSVDNRSLQPIFMLGRYKIPLVA